MVGLIHIWGFYTQECICKKIDAWKLVIKMFHDWYSSSPSSLQKETKAQEPKQFVQSHTASGRGSSRTNRAQRAVVPVAMDQLIYFLPEISHLGDFFWYYLIALFGCTSSKKKDYHCKSF